MKKNIFVFVVIILFANLSVEAKKTASEKDYRDAIKMVRANGVSSDEVAIEKNSLIWQGDCDSDEGNEGTENTGFLFRATVQRNITFKGTPLEKGAVIRFCNGKAERITLSPSSKSSTIEKDGFICGNEVVLHKNGELCGCKLGKETENNGFMIPKGTEITVKDGKIKSALLHPALDSRFKNLEQGFYRFKDGQPVKLDSDAFMCLFDSEF